MFIRKFQDKATPSPKRSNSATSFLSGNQSFEDSLEIEVRRQFTGQLVEDTYKDSGLSQIKADGKELSIY